MPIYEYHCAKCDVTFEKLILKPISIVCPECGSKKVEGLISAPAIHNTSSKNDVISREYKDYRRRWKENAYMPKPKRKSTES